MDDCKNILEALKRMAFKKGIVIVSLMSKDTTLVFPGDSFSTWGGRMLPEGFTLVCIGDATRQEWDEQWKALYPSGKPDKNLHDEGCRYFRCLVQCEQMAYREERC